MNRLRLTRTKIFAINVFASKRRLYRPLLDMCHKVEENALKSYNNMSYNCGLDLELFIPMFQMYELLGAELPVTVRDLTVSSPAEKSEVFHKIWRFARNKTL